MTEISPTNSHISVLLKESIDLIGAVEGGMYLDATLGLGGHTLELLSRTATASVLGIDQDLAALAAAEARLSEYAGRVRFVHANFSAISAVAASEGCDRFDGIIADLGVSSLQLDSEKRGFSFRFDAPLDMRMDASGNVSTAADLLAEMSEEDIANVIYLYGEERRSRTIARRIVERRDAGDPIRTTRQLAELVERCVKRSPKDKIHPATRTFQALRIAVNGELEILELFLRDAVALLKPNGRLAVITFHSLEGRIVKQTFQKLSGKCFCPPRMPVCVCGAQKTIEIVTKKPIAPTDDEQAKNPRSRSAKLRVVRRIADQINP